MARSLRDMRRFAPKSDLNEEALRLPPRQPCRLTRLYGKAKPELKQGKAPWRGPVEIMDHATFVAAINAQVQASFE